MKPFLSIKEASKYFGLEYKSVYRLVRAGEIPAARLGGVYRIKLADLESYFEEQKKRIVACNGKKSIKSPVILTRCERCLRNVRDMAEFVGKCESPNCTERLCNTCWNIDGARRCSKHELSRTEPVQHQESDHSNDAVAVSVTDEQVSQVDLSPISTRKISAGSAAATNRSVKRNRMSRAEYPKP